MKKQLFTVEQIVSVLKQAEMGLPMADLVRRVGITERKREVLGSAQFVRAMEVFEGLYDDPLEIASTRAFPKSRNSLSLASIWPARFH